MKLHLPVRLRESLIAAIIAVTSGVYNAYAETATNMNIKLGESIAQCGYQRNEDFFLTFKVKQTVPYDSMHATTVLGIGDDAVWGTVNRAKQSLQDFLLFDPVDNQADSVSLIYPTEKEGKLSYSIDYGTFGRSSDWLDTSSDLPMTDASTGWRIQDSLCVLRYNSEFKTATLTTTIYNIDSKGAKTESKDIELTLTNIKLNAQDLHFVTTEDVWNGKWTSPSSSVSTTEFYKTLDDPEHAWLSGLAFLNISADSIVIIGDDDNYVDEGVSGPSVVIISPEGDNTVDGAKVVATEDDVRIIAPEGTNTVQDSEIVAEDDIIIDGKDNVVDQSSLDAKGDIIVTADEDNTIKNSDLAAGQDIIIEGKNNDVKDTPLDAARDIKILAEDSNTISGDDLNAGRDIIIDGKDNEIVDTPLVAETGKIQITADETNTISGDSSLNAKQDITVEGKNNEIAGTPIASDSGSIEITAAEKNTITGDGSDNSKVQAGLDIIITGKDNDVEGTPLDAARDIKISADMDNSINGSDLNAGRNITIEGDNTLNGSELMAGKNKEYGQNGTIELKGNNAISGGTKLDADHIVIKDDNHIEDANIHASKSVTVLTGPEAGKQTIIGNGTVITSGQVSIAGASPKNQADITGANTVIAATKDDKLGTSGDVILDNAKVHDVGEPVTSNGGNIILKNTDDIANATLSTRDKNGKKPGTGSIVADSGSTINLGANAVLDGRLRSVDTTAVINKTGSDDLLINFDDTGYNGTINMNGSAKLTITDELVPADGQMGVGPGSRINLNGSKMMVDAVQDAAKPVTTILGNLNARGSAVQINPGVVGDAMVLSSLTMGNGGLLYIDADPVNKVADHLSISGDLYNDGTPFLYVHNLTDPDSAEDGTRIAVLDVKGSMTGLTSEVLSDNAPKDLNMYLSFVDNKGYLVYSSNFRTVHGGPNQNAVQEPLVNMMDAAAPGGMLDKVEQALRHTRSEAATLDALQSLSAAANLIVPNMVMDSTRHHFAALRHHMDAPVCQGERAIGRELYAAGKRHAVWAAYTGGHNHMGGDNALDAYNSNYQGAMAGYTAGIGYGCIKTLGGSIGYEHASGSVTGAKAKANTLYLDLYAVSKGKYVTQRFNLGVGIHNYKVTRDTDIEAGGLSYHGRSSSSQQSTSLNLGYEISHNYAYSSYTTYTPYAAVLLGLHSLDDISESGQGNAGVNTNYDNLAQLDLSAGVQWSRVTGSFSSSLPGKVFASLSLHAELSNRKPTATNSFQGYTERWKTRSMQRDCLYGEFSGGIIMPFDAKWAGRIGADFEFGAERLSIGGYAGVTYSF